MVNCGACGVAFIAEHRLGRPRKYCYECRPQVYRPTERYCRACDQPFRPGAVGRHKYCEDAICQMRRRKKSAIRAPGSTRGDRCRQCNALLARGRNNTDRRYCSKRCQNERATHLREMRKQSRRSDKARDRMAEQRYWERLGKRRCRRCGEIQELHTEFYLARKQGEGKRHAVCRSCFRDRDLQRRFGISSAQYRAMWVEQEGRCAICHTQEPGGKAMALVVDHDHKTGEVRGLLCDRCNVGIGTMGDDPDRLAAAVRYLRSRRLRIA